MSTDIAKKQDLTPDLFNKTFGGYSGMEFSDDFQTYPFLSILSDSKQFDGFTDKDTMTLSSLGKLYVKSPNGNKVTDLMTSFVGTLIKVQKGAICWKEGQLIMAKEHPLSADALRAFEDENALPAKTAKNVIRALIMPEKPLRLANGTEFPMIVVDIKGGSFMEWVEVEKQMKQMLLASEEMQEMGAKYINKVPASFWDIHVTAEQETNQQNGNKYYKYVLSVELNDFAKSKKFYQFVGSDEVRNFSLINMRPKEQEIDIDEIEKGLAEKDEEDKVDINDLPF